MVQNLRHATVGGKQLSKQIGPIETRERQSKVKAEEGEEEDNYF